MVKSNASHQLGSQAFELRSRRSLLEEGALLSVYCLWCSARMLLSCLWTLACLQLLRASHVSAALLVMRKCRQTLVGSLAASPELGGFTGELGS